MTSPNSTVKVSSVFAQTYALTQYPGGPAVDLTGLTVEFVVRPNVFDQSAPPLITVSSTGSTAQGSVTVTPASGLVAVSLTPAATALLNGMNKVAVSLWTQPNTSSAIEWLGAELTVQQVAGP